jgi:sugar-specific transcriptional regulator TrmB
MSLKRIVSTLISLGLSRKELCIYIFLAVEGPREAQKIAKAMKISQNELASRLRILEYKGLVMIVNNVVPSQFYAIPFEDALDLLVETNLKQAQSIEQNKKVILGDWISLIKENSKK